jgi:hypothetical protein
LVRNACVITHGLPDQAEIAPKMLEKG